jgi:hypothetical protein
MLTGLAIKQIQMRNQGKNISLKKIFRSHVINRWSDQRRR